MTGAALFATATGFGQTMTRIAEGPVYNSDGQMILYYHRDGTCDTYAYDLNKQPVMFDRVTGKMTGAAGADTDNDGPNLQRRRRPKPTPTPAAATTLDERLYTNYNTFSGGQVNWSVCGILGTSFGCFQGGNFQGLNGGFGKVAALLQTRPVAEAAPNTISRDIYIVDTQDGPNKTDVFLYIFRRTEVITPVSYQVSTALTRRVTLPLVGGPSAIASMAANDPLVVIGTNLSPDVAVYHKGGFTAGGSDMPVPNVLAITADERGNINISSADFFAQIGPSGKLQKYGGGSSFLLNSTNGFVPPAGLSQ
jgi:hypothetical protein